MPFYKAKNYAIAFLTKKRLLIKKGQGKPLFQAGPNITTEKEVADISSSNLTQIWSNEIINQKFFPTNLKLAHLTPVFKKIDTTLAENYRAHYQCYQRCLRNSCKNSLTIVSTNFYVHFSVAT